MRSVVYVHLLCLLSRIINSMYRVTIQLVQSLLLTSKLKFRFSLARPGKARPKRNFFLESTGGFAQAEWSPCTYLRAVDVRDDVPREDPRCVGGRVPDHAEDDDAVAHRGGQVQARAQVVQDLGRIKGY